MFEKILKLSMEVGFDLVGVSDGKSLKNLKSLLLERKARGLESSIEEEDIEKRISPETYLSNYKSIISLGLSYNFPRPVDGMLKVSKSSQGLDYHIVMEKKLSALVERLKVDYGGEYVIFSDKLSLIEREVAVDSGLGFYGKNSSVINPVYGSFIFLGGILTDLKIETTGKVKGDCGDCDLCIKACPSGALSEDAFNPNRCLSFLTQKKGELSFEESVLINSLYGCDICQNVCPYNKSAMVSSGKDFLLKEVPIYEAVDILTLSNKNFQKKYGMIAGSWRGVKVLRRNLIIYLANKKIKECFDIIDNLEDNNIGVIKALEYYKRRGL